MEKVKRNISRGMIDGKSCDGHLISFKVKRYTECSFTNNKYHVQRKELISIGSLPEVARETKGFYCSN